MIDLKHKTVLITGASSGIGEACARHFAARGARLLICARTLANLQTVAEKLRQNYQVTVHAVALDVRDHDQIQATWAGLSAEWRNIDVLVNNAGLAAGLASLAEGEVADWEVMIDTNVKGLLYMTKQVLPNMLARNTGHVINIGSISSHQVYPKGTVYCATKHAENAISRGVRMEVLGSKIRVTTVDPGAVLTNFSLVRFKGDSARAAAVYADMQPLTADDVADAVVYCATRPLHVNVDEIILMPTDQVSVQMLARHPKSE